MNAEHIHVLEYVHLLRRKKITILASFLSVFVLVCLINWTQKPIYRTLAELMVDREQTTLVLGSSILSVDTIDDTYFFTQRRVLKSRPVAQLVAQKILADPANLDHVLGCFDMAVPKKGSTLFDPQRAELVGAIQGSAELEFVPKTRMFHVSVTGHDPVGVAIVANRLSEVFIEYNTQFQLSTSQQAFLAFTSKLQELKDRLNFSEFALQKIQLELKLAEMLKSYEDKHPEVIKMREQISNYSDYLKQQLDKVRQTLGADRTAREQRESVLFSYLASQDARQGQGLEGRKSLSMFLEQEVLTNRDMYNTFFKKFQEMNLVNQQAAGTRIKIIEEAGVPGRPIRPNKKLNLIFGCVVGLTLGVGIAFFQDYLDNTIKTSDDVQKYLHLMLLGIIPAMENVKGKNGNGNKGSGSETHRLMTLHDNSSPTSEAYRTMRTNILLTSVDRPLRTLAVTSSVQKEGKTTTAINLAISIARAGSKVLLVDADLRRPVLAKTFQCTDKSKGDLVDLLTGRSSIEDALYPSGVEHLTILPCTKIAPNPSELLGSAKMKGIIQGLKEKFELILFDSPPLIAVTDAVVLSTIVDGVILVASSGVVPRGICMQAKSALDNAKAHILGAVLNNVKVDQGSYNYYHYYRYYNSYTSSTTATSDIAAVR